MITRAVIFVALIATVAGCGTAQRVGDRLSTGRVPSFDGQFFRTSVDSERGNRAAFVATARPASASLKGAIAAAEYRGIQHCIHFYGTSDIVWGIGPDIDAEALEVTDDTVVFDGICRERS